MLVFSVPQDAGDRDLMPHVTQRATLRMYVTRLSIMEKTHAEDTATITRDKILPQFTRRTQLLDSGRQNWAVLHACIAAGFRPEVGPHRFLPIACQLMPVLSSSLFMAPPVLVLR